MRFFLFATYVPINELAGIAQAAEALGFHALTIPDHIVYPTARGTGYPYTGTGQPVFDEESEWPDPFVAASAALVATRSLAVLTALVVLPMRDPLLVAKSSATLASLSPGRFSLGVGVGWWREEFEALGFDFTTRGGRTAEGIEIMRLLWRGERVSYQGRFRSFPELRLNPVPPEPIPIYTGGASMAALRRAALLCDGIVPTRASQVSTAELLATIARLRDEYGRTEPFDYVAAAMESRTPLEITEIARLGVGSVHVDPFTLYYGRCEGLTLDERRTAMERYAREVIEPTNR